MPPRTPMLMLSFCYKTPSLKQARGNFDIHHKSRKSRRDFRDRQVILYCLGYPFMGLDGLGRNTGGSGCWA